MEAPIDSWYSYSKKNQTIVSSTPFLQRNGTGEHGQQLYTSHRVFPAASTTGNEGSILLLKYYQGIASVSLEFL